MVTNVTFTKVYIASYLVNNIVSYGKLKRKGFALIFDSDKRALERCSDGIFMFDVAINSNVLYVETAATHGRHSAKDAIMAAIEAHAVDANADDVHVSLLLH